MSSNAPSVASIPPPEKLKAELLELYRAVRYTRSLLKLSERIHTRNASDTKREAVHAAR